MPEAPEDILARVASIGCANEAEVESKVILPLLPLLGYSDSDRADKPAIDMQFGRERKTKYPDFLIYDGPERSPVNALLTIEAKAPGESLEEADSQAKSYALWAGTPYYLLCNGDTLVAVRFHPGVEAIQVLEVPRKELQSMWRELYGMLARSELVKAKERISYIACYLPRVEDLPPHQFFREYLERVVQRFSAIIKTPRALDVSDHLHIPPIPVTIKFENKDACDISEQSLVNIMATDGSRMLITGDAGCGKTTLCMRTTARLAGLALGGEPVLPIYVRLSEGVPATLNEAFSRSCKDMGVRTFPLLAGECIKQAKVIAILDGLDELQDTESNWSLLDEIIGASGLSSVIVTTRPLGGEKIEETMLADYARARVRDLTEVEFKNVMVSYTGNETAARRLIRELPHELRVEMRTPLFAMMALRIGQTRSDWKSLHGFSLYEAYVQELNQFFNSARVRAVPQALSLAEIMDSLSRIAIQVMQATPADALTVDQIEDDEGAQALLNTGIIRFSEARVTFVHKTFCEFGLGIAIIRAIRGDKSADLAEVPISEEAFRLTASALTEDEEQRLCNWLSIRDKNIRKRILGILGNRHTDSALVAVLKHIDRERSIKNWGRALRILVASEAFAKVESIMRKDLSDRRVRIVASALRETPNRQTARLSLELARKFKGRSTVTAALEIALLVDDAAAEEDLLDLYLKLSANQRFRFASSLRPFKDNKTARSLIMRIIVDEPSHRILSRILPLIADELHQLDDDVVWRLSKTIQSGSGRLRGRDVKGLQYVGRRLLGTRPCDEALRSVCHNITSDVDRTEKE